MCVYYRPGIIACHAFYCDVSGRLVILLSINWLKKIVFVFGLGTARDQWCIGGGVYAGIRRIPTSRLFWQRILTSVIINKQGTFRPFAAPLCVYPPPFLAIHHCPGPHCMGSHDTFSDLLVHSVRKYLLPIAFPSFPLDAFGVSILASISLYYDYLAILLDTCLPYLT